MPEYTTFPSEHALRVAHAHTPEFMRPSFVPYAVTFPGILQDDDCDLILENLGRLEPYRFKGCDALTRECHEDPSLDVIEMVARQTNEWFFHYELDKGQHSWLQSYELWDGYHTHMDGSPGQTRKLTAVAMLTHPRDYDGGNLTLFVEPKEYPVPRTRGTVVVFQHWVDHAVEQVTDGRRQTINMGFWGPPFR